MAKNVPILNIYKNWIPGLSLLYAVCAHATMQFFLAVTPNAPIFGCTMGLGTNWMLLFSCGYPLHLDDLGQGWTQYVSPVRWILNALVEPELKLVTSITCRPIQVINSWFFKGIPIYTFVSSGATSRYYCSNAVCPNKWTRNAAASSPRKWVAVECGAAYFSRRGGHYGSSVDHFCLLGSFFPVNI